ncbi:MAG: autotransporter domain-containing protein [Halieaceae bacterium]|nr:autotransporter domain-containing protein [Halieaceae bacterium]
MLNKLKFATVACLIFPVLGFSEERYVFLGDSLVDNQNSYLATLLVSQGTYVIPDSPPYFNGRFSNGPNWTDLLAPNQGFYMNYLLADPGCNSNLAADVQDLCGELDTTTYASDQSLGFAFGGSLAGNAPLSATNPAGMNAVLSDLQRFVNAGAVSGLEQATFALLTGGNDYTNYAVNPGDVTVDQVVAGTIANIDSALQIVSGFNAKRAVVLNIFDLDITPVLKAYFDDTTLAMLKRISRQHNDELLALTQQYQSNQTLDVVLVDVRSMYTDFMTRPTVFGFENITGACISNNLATGDCPTAAAEDATLYWDGQHPTRAAHHYIFQLFQSTLTAVDVHSQSLWALSDASLYQASLDLDRLTNHTRQTTLHDTPKAQGFFVIGSHDQWDRGTNAAAYDSKGESLTIGYQWQGRDMLNLNVYASQSKQTASVTQFGGFEHNAQTLGLSLAWYQNSIYALGQIQYTQGDIDDLVRLTGFDNLERAQANTNSSTHAATAEVGKTFSLGDPARALTGNLGFRLSYLDTEIDAYQEQSASFLNLAIQAFDRQALYAEITSEVARTFTRDGGYIRPALSLNYRREVLNNTTSIDGQFSSGQTINSNLTGFDDESVLINATVVGAQNSGVQWSIGINYANELTHNQDRLTAQVGLVIPW